MLVLRAWHDADMPVTIIGVDCATDPKRTGLALARFTPHRTVVEQVCLGSSHTPPAGQIVDWLDGQAGPALLAFDAPLGWPAPLADALARHQAGGRLPTDANTLFRRETDRFVKERIGKRPLDVGADLIARTAHAALALLEEIRHQLDRPIPLAQHPSVHGVQAIEVYPAATLIVHKVETRGYKRADGLAARRAITTALGRHLQLPKDTTLMLEHHDVLDAVGCVLAGQDFLLGEALPPENEPRAIREGWIWVRTPGV